MAGGYIGRFLQHHTKGKTVSGSSIQRQNERW
jgi:hypothetical protein